MQHWGFQIQHIKNIKYTFLEGARQFNVARSSEAVEGRPKGARDVHSQKGPDWARHLPQDTQVQELHGRHGQQKSNSCSAEDSILWECDILQQRPQVQHRTPTFPWVPTSTGPAALHSVDRPVDPHLLSFSGGPFAPFVNNWHLKEDYKKVSKRKELADSLSKHILWFAVINFLLCPVILLWQILYSFFTYAEVWPDSTWWHLLFSYWMFHFFFLCQMIKREPESLGSRCWSLHGRLYLRHFNELDHELNARLNRAYRPASKYMNIFTSPVMTVIAKYVVLFIGLPVWPH